ncbi:MAG: FecR domain-containing protein [Elusimicrobia bacterium]|nr:FecR domain-containing protein [Elusimicrobiota bacterium]
MLHHLVLSSLLSLAPQAQAQSMRIGAAAAVRGGVSARAPGQAVGRVMESGKEVYLRDAVTTDADGRMQVLLLDETVFTIGPNSSLILDEFVYDPAKGSGRMTARVTKGVFRFVTGKIARETPSNMRVKLPVGVIGIRGTIVAAKIFSPTKATAILVGPGPRNNASERPGQIVVTAAGKDSTASRPGMAIDVTPAGPSAPYIAPPNLVNEVASDLAPKSDEAASSGGGSSEGGSGTAASTEGSATEESGQAAAGALGDLANTDSIAEATQDNSNITENASQSSLGGGITDGIAKWEDLRSFGSGTAHFSQVIPNAGTCSGGVCGGSTDISASVCFYVDFGARAITNGSDLALFGGSFSDSVFFSGNHSFASLSGDAVIALGSGGPTVSNSRFDGTTFTLINSGGVPAAQMAVNFQYDDGSGVTASGNAAFTKE